MDTDFNAPVPISFQHGMREIAKAYQDRSISYATFHTLRLLLLQFFREDNDSAELADNELLSLYNEILETEDFEVEVTQSSFEDQMHQPDGFVEKENKSENVSPPYTPVSCSYVPLPFKVTAYGLGDGKPPTKCACVTTNS